jgi:hypothetical protein
MERDELEGVATPEQLAAAVERSRDDLARLQHTHEHPTESIRELTYKGHHIRIVTTYQIEVDGAPITGHLSLTHEGTLHYHAIPNQEFDSAVDMVKRIIDLSPEGLTPAEPGHGGPPHGGHG